MHIVISPCFLFKVSASQRTVSPLRQDGEAVCVQYTVYSSECLVKCVAVWEDRVGVVFPTLLSPKRSAAQAARCQSYWDNETDRAPLSAARNPVTFLPVNEKSNISDALAANPQKQRKNRVEPPFYPCPSVINQKCRLKGWKWLINSTVHRLQSHKP